MAGAVAAALAGALLVQPLAATPSYAGIGCDGPLPIGDCTAPETVFSEVPPSSTDARGASFTFTTQPTELLGATFECRLDGPSQSHDWSDCTVAGWLLKPSTTGSKFYTALEPGDYTFSARATDSAGNTDPTPATHAWTIEAVDGPPDAESPNTVITKTGKRWHPYPYLGVRYQADEGTVGFICTLNGQQLAEQYCSSDRATLLGLGARDHTFTVAAVDAAGNVDPTPATSTWTVPQDDSGIKKRQGWKRKRENGYLYDTYTTTRQKGATLTKGRKNYRSAALVVGTCPTCGKVDVFLGKKRIKRINLYSAKRKQAKVVTLGSWRKPQSRVIKVKVVSKGKDVIIDGIGFSQRR